MAFRDILLYPDPKLMEVCAAVGDGLDGLAELVREMAEAMFSANGVGLAAPQIGVLKRVFIIDQVVAGGTDKDPPLAFVDPEIIELSPRTEVAEEGCLSFPGVYVPVRRSLSCKTRARGVDGQLFVVEGEALFARAMQHEADHLDGRLITDYVGRVKRKLIRRKMERVAAERAASQ